MDAKKLSAEDVETVIVAYYQVKMEQLQNESSFLSMHDLCEKIVEQLNK